MGLSVQQTPNQVNGVTKSIFVAARNPILYKFLRVDNLWNQINNNGGFHQLQFNGIDLTAYYQVGNSVYVSHGTGAFFATITASAFSAGNTLVTLTTVYVAIPGTGFSNNLSKRTDWKVEIEVFRASDNTSLTDFKFSYYPDRTGICNAYVHTILAAFLSPDWANPVTSNEAEVGSDLRFYVKYNEYYDGVAQAVVNDSANQYVAVNAAMQIYYSETTYGDGGNMQGFVPADSSRPWMTRFVANSSKRKIRLWRDWPFTLSFIWPSVFPSILYVERHFDGSGTLIQATESPLTISSDRVNRLKVETDSIPETTKKIELYLTDGQHFEDDQHFPGGGTTFENIIVGAQPAGNYSFNGFVSMLLNSGVFNDALIQIDAYNGGAFVSTLEIEQPGGPGDVTFNFNPATVYAIPGAWDRLGITIDPGVAVFPDYNFAYDINFLSTQITSTLSIDVQAAGENPLYLFWKNSAGGDSFSMFAKNQEYQTSLANGKKAKRMTLFAERLDAVEWDAINELNSNDEIYRNNLTELSSSVIKSHSQIGQQVYIVDQAGNKIGVTVVPSQPRSETRKSQHAQEVVIELPEAY